jgi:hypothetical protein
MSALTTDSEPVSCSLVHRIATSNLRFPWVILLFWAVLYLPRALLVGFYHDDWWLLVEAINGTAPFSLDRFTCFVSTQSGFAPRPVQGIACFLVSSIGGTHPFAWQVASALATLFVAVSVRRLFLRLARPASGWQQQNDLHAMFSADIATLVVIANPWSIGLTIWAHMTGAVLSLGFFAQGATEFFRDGSLRSRSIMCFLWLLASFLSYESLYLQWCVLPILLLVLFGFSRNNWRVALALSAAAGLAQSVAIGFNRWIALKSPSNSKATPENWRELAQDSFRNLPDQLHATMPDTRSFWQIWLVAVVAVAVLSVVLRSWSDRGQWMRAARSLVLPFAGVLMIAITALVYALGAYAISTLGFASRTTYGLGLGLALIALGLLQYGLGSNHLWLRQAARALAMAAVAVMAFFQLKGLADFAHVWRVERDVISAFPIQQLRGVRPQEAAVLYVGPSYYRDIIIFGAAWDLTGAINNLPSRGPSRRAYADLLIFHPATGQYNWSWSGGKLVQELPDYWRQSYDVKHLYVWNYYTREFALAKDGLVVARRDHPEFHQP